MTNHKATTRQWSGIERFVRYGAYDSCLIELRDRVEALEAAQQKATVKPATRLHSYRVENSALPIEEWGKGHAIVDSARPPVTRDRAEDAPESSDLLIERVADAIYSNATGGVREEARAAILAVADWLDQQELHIAATRLRMEAQ